jgi:hypothetical protein
LQAFADAFKPRQPTQDELDNDAAQRARFFESVRQAYVPGAGAGRSAITAIADKGSFADFERFGLRILSPRRSIYCVCVHVCACVCVCRYTAARGSSLMRKMGWRYGAGLGPRNDGDPEPLVARSLVDVAGMPGVLPAPLRHVDVIYSVVVAFTSCFFFFFAYLCCRRRWRWRMKATTMRETKPTFMLLRKLAVVLHDMRC